VGQDERLLLGSSFGAAAIAYAEHRPDYAQAAVRWALERAPGSRVLDLGAGTGKLTATLVSLGAEVIAVEPDPAMLTELRRALPTVRALPGSAEAVPLPDASVDAVLAGNAMHWFDMNIAGPEIARVLEPDGILAGLWNVFDLARRDGRSAPPKQWVNRTVRLAGAGRVLAWAATDRRLPRRDVRDEGGSAGHARTGTRGHARSYPRFPREQTGARPRRIHPADADRRAPRRATVKTIDDLYEVRGLQRRERRMRQRAYARASDSGADKLGNKPRSAHDALLGHVCHK
jgi:SAM-dependent methyltransferase